MDQIQQQLISFDLNLDLKLYFQSLLMELEKKKILESNQKEKLQLGLATLLNSQVERFTNGESSSIPIENAQGLLQSICYCVGACLKACPDLDKQIDLLKEEELKTLFWQGVGRIQSMMESSKSVLNKLRAEKLQINNLAYHDTIDTGIPEFFYHYNVELAAHEDGGSIDYPLCLEISDKSGAEYIELYLTRLKIENNFCRKFSEERIEGLLQAFSNESKDILVNIYELVLTNALGCEMLEKDISELSVTSEDLIWIQSDLKGLTMEELRAKLCNSYEHINRLLNLEDSDLKYAKGCIDQIALRLKNNLITDALGQMFLPLSENVSSEVGASLYEAGTQLEDERLRELIEEIRECRFTADKIAILKREVHSLYDLEEILSEAFFDQEYESVFELLNEQELDFLRQCTEEEEATYSWKKEDPLKEWQKQLLFYCKRRKV